ncbi:MAG: hypothetical protein H0X44_01300, partial [Acidobacteria bacterium]|nr:hypothetical protein [Acidobacteriota bacterium]
MPRARPPLIAPSWLAAVALAGIFAAKLIVMWQLRNHPLLHPDAGLDTTAYV